MASSHRQGVCTAIPWSLLASLLPTCCLHKRLQIDRPRDWPLVRLDHSATGMKCFLRCCGAGQRHGSAPLQLCLDCHCRKDARTCGSHLQKRLNSLILSGVRLRLRCAHCPARPTKHHSAQTVNSALTTGPGVK